MARKIILKTHLSPGDICTLTAAIESLHVSYPGEFLTDVRTSCDDLFQHNPHVTKLVEAEAETIEMHYPLVNSSDAVPNPFLRGYCRFLGEGLGVPLELTTNRPHLYLSEGERTSNPITELPGSASGKYWLLTAGVKSDFTLKQWPIEFYQEVVGHFAGKVQFVQIGSAEHDHIPLDGVIDLLGQTTTRQLIQLAYHAEGGIGPITFLQHLCAAFEKPYVALLGGREPVNWTQYPLQTTLHTLGKLPCCRTRSCWRSRVVRLNDGSEQDNSLCESPVLSFRRPVGKCMSVIRPADVIRAIEGCYEGGALTYLNEAPANRALSPPHPQIRHVASEEPADGPALEIVAHSAWGFDVQIVPAWASREWMDATGQRFAYHCLPMVLANQSGWFVLAPHDAEAEWNGGPAASDLVVRVSGNPHTVQAMSQVGSGIVTWMIPYVFRTSPGWNLLCRGPSNFVKDGICPLEGLVETDWSVASFSMNWKLTRRGKCAFKAGEPIAMLVPQRRHDLEEFDARFANLSENRKLAEGYGTWIKARHEFWAAQKRGDAKAVQQKFQKHYFRGCTNDGTMFPDHQKAREVSAFRAVSATTSVGRGQEK